MARNPQHGGSFTFLDSSNEQSTMNFFFGPITALTIAGFLTDFGDFRDATEDVILGSIIRDAWYGDITQYEKIIPTDANAQRERKASVSYQDDVTFETFRVEIPTVILDGMLLAGTDLFDLSGTEWAAWVTAFETLCQSPNGNAITVLQARAVGRAI